MAILSYLDVSTAHVTQNDMELLGCNGPGGPRAAGPEQGVPVFAYPYEAGCFITGPDFTCTDGQVHAQTDTDCREFGLSDSFLKLLEFA